MAANDDFNSWNSAIAVAAGGRPLLNLPLMANATFVLTGVTLALEYAPGATSNLLLGVTLVTPASTYSYLIVLLALTTGTVPDLEIGQWQGSIAIPPAGAAQSYVQGGPNPLPTSTSVYMQAQGHFA